MPNKSSQYTPKVLELVAKEIGEFFTGNQIVEILLKSGMSREEIQYPNTKWWTINEAFKYKQNQSDGKVSSLIEDFLHPLNHNLEEKSYKELAKKVQKYLSHDNLIVQFNGPKEGYFVLTQEELTTVSTPIREEYEEDEKKKHLDIAKIKEHKEEIKKIKELHQSYMDVIELFCNDIKKPTKELNDAYLFLIEKMEKILGKINLQYYELKIYRPFRDDLYTAEYEWNGDGSIFSQVKLNPRLSWDTVRPHLYSSHSQIEKIYSISEKESNLSDDEKKLEEISLMILNKRTDKNKPKKDKVRKMEILHKYEDKKTTKSYDLNNANVSFDDSKATIHIDELEIPLPEYAKEHYLARSIFKRRVGEPIDWSIVYQEMQAKNTDDLPDANNWRYVYDACNDINKRIREVTKTKQKLFEWSNKTIKRLH